MRMRFGRFRLGGCESTASTPAATQPHSERFLILIQLQLHQPKRFKGVFERLYYAR